MAINLAAYEKMESTGFGDFVKFEKTGDTKFLRFMYKSGGNNMGEDVEFRRKKWDDDSKKYVYDSPDGQLVCALKCIEYDADGKNPRFVRWEKSAYFCKTVLLPMWRNYPRICDAVWKVTATNPKTIDATYSLFPVIGADTISHPIIEEPNGSATTTASAGSKETPAANPAEEKKPKKKYWEN